MKIAYLFLNGELRGSKKFYLDFIEKNMGDIYCADGGANICYELGLTPKEIYGDLDSIKNEVKEFYQEKNIKFIKFQVEKDYTDSELILNEIQNKYNIEHNITPKSVKKDIREIIQATKVAEDNVDYKTEDVEITDYESFIEDLKNEMLSAADSLDFERAASIRDEIKRLKEMWGLDV